LAAKKQNPFLLRKFKEVNPEYVAQLEALGIKQAGQMLSLGQTPMMRTLIATMVEIPETAVVELVKLSDLSRLPGVKGTRARLYYAAGVDSVEKLAAYEPKELLAVTAEYVHQTGFEGIAPLPKEISSTISNARMLPKVVEW
jgi:hypothetical protein